MVWSDKADYAPGELVTLSGAHWQPGETVHIRVNDDSSSSWDRDVDVTADETGGIADEFNLPNWFVANYRVTATGDSGAVATHTFTDQGLRRREPRADGRAHSASRTVRRRDGEFLDDRRPEDRRWRASRSPRGQRARPMYWRNYQVERIDGTLTMIKAPLSVRPDDATRKYGEANPGFTGVITGIKNGDDVKAEYFSAATPQRSKVGDLCDRADGRRGGDAVRANYDVAGAGPTERHASYAATRSVNKADDTTKDEYGYGNPEFDGTLMGVKEQRCRDGEFLDHR